MAIEVIKRESLQRELNQQEFDQNMAAIIELQSVFWSFGVVKDSLKLGGQLPNYYASQTDVATAISNLIDSSPETLDTLNELATALGNDPNFATTVSTSLGNRLRVDIANQGLTPTQILNALTNLGINTIINEKFISINSTIFSWAKKPSNSTNTLAAGEIISNGRLSDTIHIFVAEYVSGDVNDFGTLANDFTDGSYKNVEYIETA